MQDHILHPLRLNVGGDFPQWILPVRLNVGGAHLPLDRLHEAFVFDYENIIGTAVLQNLQVQEWRPVFYDEEPDSTTEFARDRPRLDNVIFFTDGT